MATNNTEIDDKKYIDQLLANGERVTLECKRAKKDVPHSLWETYSAFANTDGGTIILGVDEDLKEKDISKRFNIIGVEDAAKIRTDIWNTLNSREKVSSCLLRDEDINTLSYDGKDVVVIHVPRADYEMRPIYINNNLMRGTYRRRHEGDYHCPEPIIRMMLRDACDDGNDRMFLEHYTMDDIDVPTLEAYRNMFRVANLEHVWNGLEPQLVEQPELMQVKLELKIVNAENPTASQEGRKEGQKEEQKELSSRQLEIIHLLEKTPSATMPQIAEAMAITYRTVRRDMEYLQKSGIISREGGRKEGRWIINKQ